MIDAKKRSTQRRAVFSAFLFSIVLVIFPVASGVIVATNHMGTLQGYWVQGAFMVLSLVGPAVVMSVRRIHPGQIGFGKIEKGGAKTALYFVPIIAAKMGFLFFGINSDPHAILALAFFTAAIGLSEEVYFRGIILRRLMTCFPMKQAVLLASVLFAAVHASQAFAGSGPLMVTLTILNAFIFGVVAAEITILTKSLIPAIVWHAFFDLINWAAWAQGGVEAVLIGIQSVILILYAAYLWTKLPGKREYSL